MEFRDLINSSPVESRNFSEEARFSFLQGGYVEDFDPQGSSLIFLIYTIVMASLSEKIEDFQHIK